MLFRSLFPVLEDMARPVLFITVIAIVFVFGIVIVEPGRRYVRVALLLTAGMQLIPGELYEAAAIDGATAWDRFWRITFPLLRPTMLVALLFRMIDVFRMLDLPFVLTGGGPGQATETLSLYTYRVIFTDLKFGGGSALAVLTFLMILGTAFIFIRVLGAPVAGAESER